MNSRAIKTALAAYFALGVGVGSIPDGFARSLSLGTVSEFAQPFLPSIESLSAISPFPNALWLHLVAMWVMLPLAAYRIGRAWTFNPRMFEFRASEQWLVIGSIWVGALVVAYFMYGYPHFVPENHPHAGGRGVLLAAVLVGSRPGVAFGATTAFCILGVLVGVAVRGTAEVLVKSIQRRKISPARKH